MVVGADVKKPAPPIKKPPKDPKDMTKEELLQA